MGARFIVALPPKGLKRGLVSTIMLNMREPKTISGRTLRHGTPEESLTTGETVRIQKRNGKTFELKRVDGGQKSMISYLDELLKEVPLTIAGKPVRTNLARTIIEERE